MILSHIRLQTADNLRLAGLLYEPDSKSSNEVLIWLHGNGGSNVLDAVEKFEIIGKTLTNSNISLFAFNNRGALQYHHNKQIEFDSNGIPLKKYIPTGTAYEVIKECVFDIDSTIEKLKSLGYSKFYLAGTSTGANKICVYNHYKPENEIDKYILLSGGDDTGIYYAQMGKWKFRSVLNTARKKVEKSKGFELAPFNVMNNIYSWRGIFDILNPDGDYNCFPFYEAKFGAKLSTRELFDYFKRINKRSLVLYGEFDEYTPQPTVDAVNILKQAVTSSTNFEFEIIPGADHGFEGKEQEMVDAIVKWIRTV